MEQIGHGYPVIVFQGLPVRTVPEHQIQARNGIILPVIRFLIGFQVVQGGFLGPFFPVHPDYQIVGVYITDELDVLGIQFPSPVGNEYLVLEFPLYRIHPLGGQMDIGTDGNSILVQY